MTQLIAEASRDIYTLLVSQGLRSQVAEPLPHIGESASRGANGADGGHTDGTRGLALRVGSSTFPQIFIASVS